MDVAFQALDVQRHQLGVASGKGDIRGGDARRRARNAQTHASGVDSHTASKMNALENTNVQATTIRALEYCLCGQ